MSNLSQFFPSGGLKPKSINQGSLVQLVLNSVLSSVLPSNVVLTGSQVAATLATVLSITGKGALSYLAMQSVDNTSRTHRLKITLDGNVIFDNTSSATISQNIFPIIGRILMDNSNSPYAAVENYLLFDQSLLIEYASSLTETAKTRFGYIYYTR